MSHVKIVPISKKGKKLLPEQRTKKTAYWGV